MIFSKISLRKQLYAAILLPLIVMVSFGAVLVWQSYERYLNAQEVLAVQKLANSGGELAQALPAEIFSDAQHLGETRARSDAAYANLIKTYDEFVSSGYRDHVFDEKIKFIKSRWSQVEDYRGSVDAQVGGGTVEVQNAGLALQPIPGAGIDITRRAGAFASDMEIAQLIQGYHATMQITDATLMQRGVGEQYFHGKPLASFEKQFLMIARTYFSVYMPIMFENLPAGLTAQFKAFQESPDFKFLEESRSEFYQLADPTGPDEVRVGRWLELNGKQVGTLMGTIPQIRAYIDAQTIGKFADARFSLILYSALTVVGTLLVLFMSMSMAGGIKEMLRGIQDRMTALAHGESQSEVPNIGRTDEIGEMARAVEHFRKSALENERLQAEANEMRTRSEAERIEVQRKADDEAAAKLAEATSGLAAAMRRLADGDMLCEVNEQFSEEFEGLRNDFNTSVSRLREALTTVGRLATEVDSGSTEISSASDNLAKRTEQQAASLEETAAALEEITSNVNATTRRTNEARDRVRTASAKAGESATVVGNAVQAMQRIEKSSHQINQIIGVIDEIAFQTNLLALNAGVEAARAGEAGKGFAVVAQEVRELAQRSANAAKEIKELIANSSTAVGEGVRLVNDTGSGLGEIEKLVLEVNQHMDAITTAAEEQASGLAQVNTAVNHMDQATQQNAAMVEEMNAAGVGLASESAQLRDTLARFRLGAEVSALRSTAKAMRATPGTREAVRPMAAAPRSVPASSNAAVAVANESWEEF